MSELADLLRDRARASLPPVEGRLRLPVLRGPVEVRRDRWGVPHVYASHPPDLFAAQGFLLASERLFQIDLTLRLATGRLAEALGASALPMDRFVRTVGWHRAARRAAEQWDEPSWQMVEAFLAGARAWVDRMPAAPVEHQVLGLDPCLPEGRAGAEALAAAWLLVAWGLSGNWDAELLRAEVGGRLGPDAVATLFPDLPSEAAAVRAGKRGGSSGGSPVDLLERAPRFPSGQGSNAWVVAGRRSATGKPLLANDPHLLAQVPSIWYEVHLSAPGVDVAGVCLPFAPGVVIGHNDRIAWGVTALSGDTQDLYVERLSPDGRAARYEGELEPLTVHREEVAVRGRPSPEVVEVRETRHGPILESYLVGVASPRPVPLRGPAHALRWVGAEEATPPSALHRLNVARSFEEFRAALANWAVPGLSFLYADVDGNIGYQAAGRHPVRRRGDGTVPVPGWTAEYEWDGYIPFAEMPWAFNPEEGFLVAANNKVHGESYPHLLGRDFFPPFRARRIASLLTERAVHDPRSFARIQTDTVSLPAARLVPLLLSVEPSDERQRRALALLAGWDLDVGAGSAAAAVYEVWCCRLAEQVLLPLLGEELYRHYHARRQWSTSFQYLVLPDLLEHPTATWFGEDGRVARDRALRRALDAALDELSSAMGEDMSGWSWGAIHRVRLAGPLAVSPELGELFTVGEAPHGGDEQTVNQGMFEPGGPYDAVVVASWRQVVDLADLDSSIGIHTTGQSGNPASPHYADLFPLWAAGSHHPLPFTRPAVEGATQSVLVLEPEAPDPPAASIAWPRSGPEAGCPGPSPSVGGTSRPPGRSPGRAPGGSGGPSSP